MRDHSNAIFSGCLTRTKLQSLNSYVQFEQKKINIRTHLFVTMHTVELQIPTDQSESFFK